MNSVLAVTGIPFQSARPPPRTRHQIAGYPISTTGLARFNTCLRKFGHPGLDMADLLLLASALERDGDPTPEWIARQMKRALLVRVMLVDPAWDLSGAPRETAIAMTAYVASQDDLIPDALPRFGRLDDALLIDAAWPIVHPEVNSYLDFCRARRLQAVLRNGPDRDAPFRRLDWERWHGQASATKPHRQVIAPHRCTLLLEDVRPDLDKLQ